MRALIQRVKNGKITVNDEVVGSIQQGLCVFVGMCITDTVRDLEYIMRKILTMRIFDDEENERWQKNIVEQQFEILCVSQFTLYNMWKGNKPDFHKAMPAEKAKDFYEQFIQILKKGYKPNKIQSGVFGASMQVSIQNDGPVTFTIESPGYIRKTRNMSPARKKRAEKQEEEKD